MVFGVYLNKPISTCLVLIVFFSVVQIVQMVRSDLPYRRSGGFTLAFNL